MWCVRCLERGKCPWLSAKWRCGGTGDRLRLYLRSLQDEVRISRRLRHRETIHRIQGNATSMLELRLGLHGVHYRIHQGERYHLVVLIHVHVEKPLEAVRASPRRWWWLGGAKGGLNNIGALWPSAIMYKGPFTTVGGQLLEHFSQADLSFPESSLKSVSWGLQRQHREGTLGASDL